MTMLIRDGLECVYRARRCGWIIEIFIINGPELQGVVSNDTMCDVGREGSTSGGVLCACVGETRMQKDFHRHKYNGYQQVQNIML
jgi:hypothetical protein